MTGGSKWILTGDSYIKSLTCDADSIDLNGYTLTVDGEIYTSGSMSEGKAIEIMLSEGRGNKPSGNGDMEPPTDGERPGSPDGEPPEKPDGEPPVKPDGEGGPRDGNPPDKPD